jgi:hypothetical protein
MDFGESFGVFSWLGGGGKLETWKAGTQEALGVAY